MTSPWLSAGPMWRTNRWPSGSTEKQPPHLLSSMRRISSPASFSVFSWSFPHFIYSCYLIMALISHYSLCHNKAHTWIMFSSCKKEGERKRKRKRREELAMVVLSDCQKCYCCWVHLVLLLNQEKSSGTLTLWHKGLTAKYGIITPH